MTVLLENENPDPGPPWEARLEVPLCTRVVRELIVGVYVDEDVLVVCCTDMIAI